MKLIRLLFAIVSGGVAILCSTTFCFAQEDTLPGREQGLPADQEDPFLLDCGKYSIPISIDSIEFTSPVEVKVVTKASSSAVHYFMPMPGIKKQCKCQVKYLNLYYTGSQQNAQSLDVFVNGTAVNPTFFSPGQSNFISVPVANAATANAIKLQFSAPLPPNFQINQVQGGGLCVIVDLTGPTPVSDLDTISVLLEPDSLGVPGGSGGTGGTDTVSSQNSRLLPLKPQTNKVRNKTDKFTFGLGINPLNPTGLGKSLEFGPYFSMATNRLTVLFALHRIIQQPTDPLDAGRFPHSPPFADLEVGNPQGQSHRLPLFSSIGFHFQWKPGSRWGIHGTGNYFLPSGYAQVRCSLPRLAYPLHLYRPIQTFRLALGLTYHFDRATPF